MQLAERVNTREISRAAVRSELAQVAFGLFLREGFESVTINDLAAAAGVSRSTVLRYFGTKEDAVLGTIEARGALVARALRTRPAAEDDLTALRQSLEVALEPYRQDPAQALALTRLIQQTAALRARGLEKQNSWQPLLAQALASRRNDTTETPTMSDWVWATAALGCLNIAVQQWNASDGETDLAGLLDAAFAALTSPPKPSRRRR